MKYLKTFESFEATSIESSPKERFYGRDILPKKALDDLHELFCDPSDKIEVYPDPKVEGVFAIRVYRRDLTFDLLWTKSRFYEPNSTGNPDGFGSWPPQSEELRLFI